MTPPDNLDAGGAGGTTRLTAWQRYVAWRKAQHAAALESSGGRVYATLPAWIVPGGAATERAKAAAKALTPALKYTSAAIVVFVANVWMDVKTTWLETRKAKIRKKVRIALDGNQEAQFVVDVLAMIDGQNNTLEAELLAQVTTTADEMGAKIKADVLAKWDAGAPKAIARADKIPFGSWILDQDFADGMRDKLIGRLDTLIQKGKDNALKAAQTAITATQAEWQRDKAKLTEEAENARERAAERLISRRYASQSNAALLRTLDGLIAEQNGGPKSSVKGDHAVARREIRQLLDKRGVSHP